MTGRLPPPSMMVVLSLSITTFFAVPRSSIFTFSSRMPRSSVIARPFVRMAISSSIAFRRSPNPGAFTAADCSVPRSRFTTRVARASPSISSATISSERLILEACSRSGKRFFIELTFFSKIKIKQFSSTHCIRSGSVTKYGERYPRSNCIPSTTCAQLHIATNTIVRVSHNLTDYSPVCSLFSLALFNCAQFSSSTAGGLMLMAVIWIDKFEDGRMESPIGTTLYEQIAPTEDAMKPEVYERLWQELSSLREKLKFAMAGLQQFVDTLAECFDNSTVQFICAFQLEQFGAACDVTGEESIIFDVPGFVQRAANCHLEPLLPKLSECVIELIFV